MARRLLSYALMMTAWDQFRRTADVRCTCPPDREPYLDDDLEPVKTASMFAGIGALLGFRFGVLFGVGLALVITSAGALYKALQLELRCTHCRRPTRPADHHERAQLTTARGFLLLATALAFLIGLALLLAWNADWRELGNG